MPLFWVAVDRSRIIGCVGLEPYLPVVLLRSLAVAPDYRGRGLGKNLVRQALAASRDLGALRVVLLTTTAEDYFHRFGFRPVPRDAADPAVWQSAEFRHLCPASAVVMVLDLAGAGDGWDA